MGVKISNLPPVVTPALTDIFPIVQAGVTYKETVTQLSSLLSSVGVTTITGTANQVITSAAVGPVTLSLPQSIASTSDVSFGSIVFSPSTHGIVGTTTNNDAAASYVGEYISSTVLVGDAVSVPSTGNTVDITTISLTAGDWIVWANIGTAVGAGTTTSSLQGWIGTISVTAPTAPATGARISLPYAIAASGNCLTFIGMTRISLAATTTIYLSGSAAFAVSTMSLYGYIGARRFR